MKANSSAWFQNIFAEKNRSLPGHCAGKHFFWGKHLLILLLSPLYMKAFLR